MASGSGEAARYAGRYGDPGDPISALFSGFKRVILESELETARACAKALPQYSSPARILEIGTGSGEVSEAFLKELALFTGKKADYYAGLDISPSLVEKCSARILALQGCAERAKCVVGDGAVYDDFPQPAPNLITAFNSWYGIPFSAIPRYVERLTPEGTLAILLNSEESVTLDLTRRFSDPMVAAEDLMAWLEIENVPYRADKIESTLLYKDTFLEADGSIRQKTEVFFRYLLRRPIGDLVDAEDYLGSKPDEYFRIPQFFITISKA